MSVATMISDALRQRCGSLAPATIWLLDEDKAVRRVRDYRPGVENYMRKDRPVDQGLLRGQSDVHLVTQGRRTLKLAVSKILCTYGDTQQDPKLDKATAVQCKK